MTVINEATIYKLYRAYELNKHGIDYDQFMIGMECEHDKHPQLARDEDKLVELVCKKLEIDPDFYCARTESTNRDDDELVGEFPSLPRKLKKPKRSRIESTLPPGEREGNPGDRRLAKLHKLLTGAVIVVDEIWQEDTSNIGVSKAKINIMDALEWITWEITGEPPVR